MSFWGYRSSKRSFTAAINGDYFSKLPKVFAGAIIGKMMTT